MPASVKQGEPTPASHTTRMDSLPPVSVSLCKQCMLTVNSPVLSSEQQKQGRQPAGGQDNGEQSREQRSSSKGSRSQAHKEHGNIKRINRLAPRAHCTGYCCCRSRSRSCRSPSSSPLLLLREWPLATLPLMPMPSTVPSCAELAPEAVKAVGVPVSCAWSMLRFFSRSRPITGTCCSSRSFRDFWRACAGTEERLKQAKRCKHLKPQVLPSQLAGHLFLAPAPLLRLMTCNHSRQPRPPQAPSSCHRLFPWPHPQLRATTRSAHPQRRPHCIPHCACHADRQARRVPGLEYKVAKSKGTHNRHDRVLQVACGRAQGCVRRG